MTGSQLSFLLSCAKNGIKAENSGPQRDERERRFCFLIPPFRLWEVVKFDWPFPLRQQVDSVRVVLKSHHMQPARRDPRIRQPARRQRSHADHRQPGVRWRRCVLRSWQSGSPRSKAGNRGSHEPWRSRRHAAATLAGWRQERFDLELNITKTLRAQNADATDVSLKLVAVDFAGKEVRAEELILEETVIRFE